MKVKVDFREYKGFRYAVLPNKSWRCCGYLLIDENLFKDLGLYWYYNHTSSNDGVIIWIQNRKLGDKEFEGQKDNEIYFRIDTNHTWGCSTSDGYVDSIMKEWIDWIVDNKETT
ncbi:hypothetical protein FST69_04685 [Campylobacter jejuni]|nr:hypothetical protein [Campylobacter jejuni]ECK8081110.1 hypothetical protein [Campylobacter jejuni]ECL1911346.1 hypothetical protein [Campylobacter jejuni]ECL3199580.1 hypothetical protein [Campylobacter jejuni]ECQ5573672.1 hypothetical protein [Campylobacter jejuni]